MKKITLSLILLAGCTQYSFAQADNNVPEPKKENKMEHQIGVQINGLIRQVFNFNNSAANTNTNPYLLTYNLTFKSMWGVRAGIGYNYVSNTNDDGITATETHINALQVRVGGERVFRLSNRWTAGAGLDFVAKMNNDRTVNTIHSFDTITTDTKSNGTGAGGGAMAWLRYSIAKHIQIGTEASFYYLSMSEKDVVTITNRTFGGSGGSIITTTETTSKPKSAAGTFSSPIVFYIVIKF